MKFIDAKGKKLTLWNRNYFFAATVFIIILNLTLYGVLGDDWQSFIGKSYDIPNPYYNPWTSTFLFENIIRAFLNCYSHANWQHAILNMVCFFVYGIYLERKHGTLYFLFLVFAMTFFTSCAVSANYLSVNHHGFSGVNYGFYAYFIVEYIFSFFKGKVNRSDKISGAIIIALIYLAACFCGGTSGIRFTFYPYDFMHNMGHYSGALAGLILALIINISQLISIKQVRNQ